MAEALSLQSIRDNSDIQELMSLMQAPGFESQRTDFTSLIDYVDAITKQYNTILNELDALKDKVSQFTDKKNPLVVMAENLESLATDIGERLSSLKENIISFAKNALETVKDKGLSALGSVFSFLHVKDGLQAMSNGLAKSVEALDKAVARVDNLEKHNEEKAAARDGGERPQPDGEQSRLASLLAGTRVDFENLSQRELSAVYEKLLTIGMSNDLTANENKCLQSLVNDAGALLPYTEEYEPASETEPTQDIET